MRDKDRIEGFASLLFTCNLLQGVVLSKGFQLTVVIYPGYYIVLMFPYSQL